MDMIEANIQKYNLSPFPNFTGVLDYSIAKDVKFHVKFTNIAYNIKLSNLSFDEKLISELKNSTDRIIYRTPVCRVASEKTESRLRECSFR